VLGLLVQVASEGSIALHPGNVGLVVQVANVG
jgi:hypothetical protein